MRRSVGFIVLAWSLLPGLGWAGSPSAFEHDDLDAILAGAVRGEGVDYPQVRDRYLKELDGYLNRVAGFDDASLAREERLALLINLYNATMIRAVVERFEAGYSPSADGFAVFDQPLVRVGGRRMSLNDLEHKTIRPQFKDPRIHAALVCAARSCPPLIPRAYRAADLEQVLDANMRRFVNDPARNRIDPDARSLQVSQIFEWYAEDFGGEAAIAAYVDGYTDASVGAFRVAYLPYSWDLNLALP